MIHLFIDTDVILDLLTGREPFSKEASRIFTLIESEKLNGYATSLTFNNLYYVLRKYASHNKVISSLRELSDLIHVLGVDESVVRRSLESKFKDFEDAVQCYAAQENPVIEIIVTRNTRDFKPSELPVMSPETFLKTYQHTFES